MSLPHLHPFRPRLLESLRGYERQRLVRDVGAGLTVGIVALPLALAFAIASGVKPEQGLVTAIVAGFLISLLGGSSVQIGGPAGAFIVIVYGIVQRYGVHNLLIATMLGGLMMLALGALRLGVLVRYIPVSIVIGFTNGIAVLVALSQLKDFLGLQIPRMPADFFAQLQALWTHRSSLNPYAPLVGASCSLLVLIWPKSYTMASHARSPRERLHRLAAHVPGTLVALVLATLATSLLQLPLDTIGSRFGGIPQTLPRPEWPGFSFEEAKQLLIPALTIALLGSIESLLCARVADRLSGERRHDPNQELMAQGIANMVAPLFGGIPATGTIARTVTNVKAGASSPVAGMVHALSLLVVVLVAAPLAAQVPLAALAGLLLVVAWNMGEWHEFARLRHFKLPYRATLLGTFLLTVIFDLTVAVEAGLMLACGFFIYRMSELFSVSEAPPGTALPPGVHLLRVYGSLFFGAVAKVEALAERLPPDARVLALDMHLLVSMDSTGLDALVQLQQSLERQGRRLVLLGLNAQPASLVERGGLGALLGEQGLLPDLATLQATFFEAVPQATPAPPRDG
ncbi:SulP family inorganic anion transporter [Roseateles flavus]|uniref:SulP family inorganic anion transporter n=1 Tax=Roseateles flavus TaxID=3149041 RepID=A0ABV0GIA4_9BURK